MHGPTTDPLPPKLREAVTLLQQVHEELHGSPEEDLHAMLDEVEKCIVLSHAPATVAPGDPAYAKLQDVLHRAYNQSAKGKGKERHVNKVGQRFEDQPICSLQRLYGQGYAFGQVGKKMEEASRLPKEQAVAELLGGIVYLAAAVVVLEEKDDAVS